MRPDPTENAAPPTNDIRAPSVPGLLDADGWRELGMVTWRPMERAPQDGRWIIAINRHEPDRRAVIRWDPERFGDDRPWHVSTCDQGYPSGAYTDWIPFPDCPPVSNDNQAERVDG